MVRGMVDEGADAAAFHWETIDALTPLGGIRVEDNVPRGARFVIEIPA